MIKEGFVQNETDFNNHIKETVGENGNITLEWNVLNEKDEQDKDAHNGILARMAERINDFVLHNNGYPLGTYPNYNQLGPGGFKILPDEAGPTEHTMNDTFYNHLVKADRTVTAVLTKQAAPTFDVSQILQKSKGADNRGSSAAEDLARKSLDKYDEDYQFHMNGGNYNDSNDPLGGHSAAYPNIKTADNWGWTTTNNNIFRTGPQQMWPEEDGTYSYTWLFQTNYSSTSFYLDAFEVNGIAIQIPYFPKYNWNDSYKINNEAEIYGDNHPYYTETTLADGATLRLEFLMGWNSGTWNQRHYRVTVIGARSNVVVTGLNLMMYEQGAKEFATFNLTGVYSDQNGQSQTAPAIEYYNKNNAWNRVAQTNVVVDDEYGNGINYDSGDSSKHGANIRFKIAIGYGNPYYIWGNRKSETISDQTSVITDDDGNTAYNPILPLEEAGGMLSSQYIYYDSEDGYYYIRVTTQEPYKIALLTVVARTVKYTVRYIPENSDGSESWNGFVVDSETGEMKPLANSNDGLLLDTDSMPTFKHDPEICALWDMAKDSNGDVPQSSQDIIHQFDDNGGPFYDLIYNTMATIASNSYGTIRPKDKNKKYTFVDWVLVDKDFKPVKDENDHVIQFLGGAIDLTKYAQYAVNNTAFGNNDTDIHVLRLMPVWKLVNNPFTYNVVLNWVDNLGNIHAEDFSDYWDEVVTEMTADGQVYVFLNKNAKPLLDWIANHPTYTFWNSVNNATTNGEIKAALDDYLKGGHNNYENILKALTQEDFIVDGEEHKGNKTFKRLGKDIFIVTEDNGTISIWMYENKGGLIFHKDVQEEPFTHDDEFYFTVTNAKVGAGYKTPLSGVYKAYPEFVYDDNGDLRNRTDEDALLLEFENGEVVSINGNEEVTYFTLKSGEGIALYVPDGQYTIAELGSKSGGTYKVSVEYDGDKTDDEMDDWDIPDDEDLWLRGSEQTYYDLENPDDPDFPDGISQVSATVNFEIGEANVVHTLIFHNKTTSLSVEKELGAKDEDLDKLENYQNMDFYFNVEFKLPEGYTPLLHTPLPDEDEEEYYYFNMNVYNVSDGSLVPDSVDKIVLTSKNDSQKGKVWVGTIILKAGQRAAIVMTVPENGENFNYWVEEVWNKNEWDDKDWDKGNGKPNIFTEMWTNKTGVAKVGEKAEVKVINWYGDPPDDGYLAITETRKTGGDQGETFLYKITKINDDGTDGEVLIVSVPADGTTIVRCPAGDYRVEEITDWAWRYEDGVCEQSADNPKGSKATVKVTGSNNTPENAAHADYTNKRNDKVWLGGENRKNNIFSFSLNRRKRID